MGAYILIVEDDVDILSSLAEALREEGYDVETAANGYQALGRLDGVRLPCLIFLDLMMPRMDGWKFLEQLRQRYPSFHAPVVLLSAVRNLEAEASRFDVAGFLAKPFDLADVTTLAKRLCGQELETSRERA